MTMIFQEPMTSLNPLHRIGRQVGEVLQLHGNYSHAEIEKRTLEALSMAGLPDPVKTMRMYPHELSGGMRQRVMIAMGIIASPKLLIADEPTTALDVTTQAHVLELLQRINQQTGTAVLLISHDLGVINKICSRVLVMYAGKIVEQGRTEDILRNPIHPYTKGLIASIPTRRMKGVPPASIPGRVPPVTEEKPPCPFASRCDKADKRCFTEYPGRKTISDDHILWCHIDKTSKKSGKPSKT
jgi:peptide/nickel transport system ATP-binding protein